MADRDVFAAEEIAAATGGKVVVTTQKNHRASLDIVVNDRFTVRLATRSTSRPLEERMSPKLLEDERQAFFARFSLKPEDVLYENTMTGLIKAQKQLFTSTGPWRVDILSASFPHRLPAGSEFGGRMVQVAEAVAAELRGPVVVVEEREHDSKSLAVIVDGKYTVRVAQAALPFPRRERVPRGRPGAGGREAHVHAGPLLGRGGRHGEGSGRA